MVFRDCLVILWKDIRLRWSWRTLLRGLAMSHRWFGCWGCGKSGSLATLDRRWSTISYALLHDDEHLSSFAVCGDSRSVISDLRVFPSLVRQSAAKARSSATVDTTMQMYIAELCAEKKRKHFLLKYLDNILCCWFYKAGADPGLYNRGGAKTCSAHHEREARNLFNSAEVNRARLKSLEALRF